jgi:hypothetical protein
VCHRVERVRAPQGSDELMWIKGLRSIPGRRD